jgi:7,8-dihydroneopterin 2',3'-cyclic phosphate phosphodiesterase
LIELANKIKDEELRKKVVEFLKSPALSNRDFRKYPMMKIGEARTVFSAGAGAAPVERDVLSHTIALVELCESSAKTIKKIYGIPIDEDILIAAAILHDVMHLFEYKKSATDGSMEHTGIMLDHTMLAVAELYHRGFPEPVIHIIASHFGEAGPTPPRSFEAVMLHHLDTMLAVTEYHLYAATQPQQQIPIIFVDGDSIKKLSGENPGKE